MRIRYVAVSHFWVKKLTQFFKDIVVNKDDEYFHPHPMTCEMANKLAKYKGKDLYIIQIKDKEITGYGILRGWDEGFTIPSLGIVIHSAYRNQGLGKDFMEFLHNQAESKGAAKVRLKVYPSNEGARRLYENLGYSFSDKENDQLVGYYEL